MAKPPLALGGRLTIDNDTSEAEANQVQRPDVHHALKPVEFFVGQFYVLSVRAYGGVDPIRLEPRAPHQIGEVGEARATAGRLPLDRHRPVLAYNNVVRRMEEVAVKQSLGQALAVISREH